MAPFRVLVVDESEPWRCVVSAILRHSSGWQIVGEACDGPEAVQKTTELRPDIVLLDIGSPELNGFETARQILTKARQCKILFLSSLLTPEVLRDGFSIGVQGCVCKGEAAAELVSALRSVVSGRKFVSSRLSAALESENSIAV